MIAPDDSDEDESHCPSVRKSEMSGYESGDAQVESGQAQVDRRSNQSGQAQVDRRSNQSDLHRQVRVTEHGKKPKKTSTSAGISRSERLRYPPPSRVTITRPTSRRITTAPLPAGAQSRLQRPSSVLQINKINKSSVRGSRFAPQSRNSNAPSRVSRNWRKTKDSASTAPRLTVSQALAASRPPKPSRNAVRISIDKPIRPTLYAKFKLPASPSPRAAAGRLEAAARKTSPEISRLSSDPSIPKRGVSLPSVWADMLVEPIEERPKKKHVRNRPSKLMLIQGRETTQGPPSPVVLRAEVSMEPLSTLQGISARNVRDADVVKAACDRVIRDGALKVQRSERLFRPRWAARPKGPDEPTFASPTVCGGQRTPSVPHSLSVPVLNASTSPSPRTPSCLANAGIQSSAPSFSGKSSKESGADPTPSGVVSPHMPSHALGSELHLSTLSPPYRPGPATGLQSCTCAPLSPPMLGQSIESRLHVASLPSSPTQTLLCRHYRSMSTPVYSPTHVLDAVPGTFSPPWKSCGPRCLLAGSARASNQGAWPQELPAQHAREQMSAQCGQMRHMAPLSERSTSPPRTHLRRAARDAPQYARQHMHGRWTAVDMDTAVSSARRAHTQCMAPSAPPAISAHRIVNSAFRATPRSYSPMPAFHFVDAWSPRYNIAHCVVDAPTASCVAHPMIASHPARSQRHWVLDTSKGESLSRGFHAQSAPPTARASAQSGHSYMGGPRPLTCRDADATLHPCVVRQSFRNASPGCSANDIMQSSTSGPSSPRPAHTKAPDIAPLTTPVMSRANIAQASAPPFVLPTHHASYATTTLASTSPYDSTRHRTTTNHSRSPTPDTTHKHINLPTLKETHHCLRLTPRIQFALPSVAFANTAVADDHTQGPSIAAGTEDTALHDAWTPGLGGLTLEQRLARAILVETKAGGNARDETLATHLCRQVGLRL